jgi:hypothetical protein
MNSSGPKTATQCRVNHERKCGHGSQGAVETWRSVQRNSEVLRANRERWRNLRRYSGKPEPNAFVAILFVLAERPKSSGKSQAGREPTLNR